MINMINNTLKEYCHVNHWDVERETPANKLNLRQEPIEKQIHVLELKDNYVFIIINSWRVLSHNY